MRTGRRSATAVSAATRRGLVRARGSAPPCASSHGPGARSPEDAPAACHTTANAEPDGPLNHPGARRQPPPPRRRATARCRPRRCGAATRRARAACSPSVSRECGAACAGSRPRPHRAPILGKHPQELRQRLFAVQSDGRRVARTNARRKMPAGQRDRSPCSRPASSDADDFVCSAISSSVIPRRSRSRRSDAPNSRSSINAPLPHPANAPVSPTGATRTCYTFNTRLRRYIHQSRA